jgi:hypothetical protein
MTPKEKAQGMVNKYLNDYGEKMPDGSFMLCIVSYGRAKQCALIAVDEIQSNIEEWDFMNDNGEIHIQFWRKVKQEIESLK